jgi:hypothetical protein
MAMHAHEVPTPIAASMALRRRAALTAMGSAPMAALLLAAAATWGTDPALAEEPAASETAAAGPDAFEYDFSSDVPLTLSVKGYYSVILRTRAKSIPQLVRFNKRADYAKLAVGLSLPPFSDLRAAGLYLPWALVSGRVSVRMCWVESGVRLAVWGRTPPYLPHCIPHPCLCRSFARASMRLR